MEEIVLISYIKSAFRNFRKRKAYSAITLSGLTLGLAVFTLFALLVEFIKNFDTFHKNADRIYSVVQILPGGIEGEQHSAITPAPLLPALLSEIPEIKAGSRYFPAGRMIVKHQDKIFYESRVRFVDPSFLTIFSFDMIRGNAAEVLSRPYSLVLTEAMAMKYFGDEDPVGKSLTLDNKIDVTITGVTKDVPRNSTIRYDFLVSMDTSQALYAWQEDWKAYNQAAFLLLAEGNSRSQVEASFSGVVNKYFTTTPDSPLQLYLHPLKDFFMKSEKIDRLWGSGGANFIVIWIIAVMLLLIACINYMNLSTARHSTRAREVGMRKVVGAHRTHLIKQFLGESLLMSLLALPIVILLYEVLRPVIVSYFDFILDVSLWQSPKILTMLVSVSILTGLFAGSYPAFYLSAFKPVRVLKGDLLFGKKGGRLRKTLVVVQFVFSIVLIVLTIVSIQQSRHNLRVDLGFDRKNIIAVEIAGEARDNLKNFKAALSQHQDISYVTASAALPVGWDTEQPVLPEGVPENESLNMNVYAVDYDFIEMLGIEMLKGRSFSQSFSDATSYILNETAAQQLQWQDPLGKQLRIGNQKGIVIGVVRNFHFKDLYFSKITPAVLCLRPEELNYMLVKYTQPESAAGVTTRIQESWNMLNPDLPFEHISLNSYFEDSFEGDKTAEMTGALGFMAIFLSCLGLLGLSSFAVQRKIKEIGIRKVLGASVTGIIKMLTLEFLKLVAIANLIALPIGYFLMNLMIKQIFSYPVAIGPDIFVFTVLITMLVAFITVTSQTLKAAHSNPVDSLKYE